MEISTSINRNPARDMHVSDLAKGECGIIMNGFDNDSSCIGCIVMKTCINQYVVLNAQSPNRGHITTYNYRIEPIEKLEFIVTI